MTPHGVTIVRSFIPRPEHRHGVARTTSGPRVAAALSRSPGETP